MIWSAVLVYSTRPTERPDIGYAMLVPSTTIVKLVAVPVGPMVAADAS